MSRPNSIVPLVDEPILHHHAISQSNGDLKIMTVDIKDNPGDNDQSSYVSYIKLNGDAEHQQPQFREQLPPIQKSRDERINGQLFELSEDSDQFDTPESFKYREDLELQFYKACGPLIKMMEVFGMWNSYYINPYKKSYSRLRGCGRIFNTRNYSFVILLILWFNALRFFPAFFVGPELDPGRLYFKVIYIVFLMQCALNATLMFIVTGKKDRIAIFFHHWEYAIQSNPVTAVPVKWVRRRAILFAILGVAFIIFHFVNHTGAVLSPFESIRNSSNIFVAPFYPSVPLHIVIVICNTYDFAVWIYSILFYTLLAMTLSHQFENFDIRFEKSISRANALKKFPPDFEILRKQHEELAKALKVSNDLMFTYLNLITYLTMAPLACFLLYNLLFSTTISNNYAAYLMYVIWLASIFVNVCVMSWIAALTSTKAHDPKEKVYRISVNKITMEELMQMNMFLSRLSSEPIGFTIFDLVILTKPFILTIGGLVLTYYAMISEVQTSDAPSIFNE